MRPFYLDRAAPERQTAGYARDLRWRYGDGITSPTVPWLGGNAPCNGGFMLTGTDSRDCGRRQNRARLPHAAWSTRSSPSSHGGSARSLAGSRANRLTFPSCEPGPRPIRWRRPTLSCAETPRCSGKKAPRQSETAQSVRSSEWGEIPDNRPIFTLARSVLCRPLGQPAGAAG